MQNDSREVTFQRVVNIVKRRTTVSRTEEEYTQDHYAPEWYNDRYTDGDKGFFNFHRNSTPPQEDNPYYGGETREDIQIRHQGEMRSRGRTSPCRGRKHRGRTATPARPHQGRGSRKPQHMFAGYRGEDKDGFKRRDSHHPLRDRSPIRRHPHAAIPAPHAESKGRCRSFSPDRDNSYTYQQLQQRRKEKDDDHYWTPERSGTSSSHVSSGPDDPTSQGSGVTQESCPASVVESLEVAPAACSEPSLAENQDLRARRTQVIASKALEIEEHYAQDCHTFGTVVKLLVDKKPSLEELLQAPLRANLTELKQRCLDDLKHFIQGLDQLNPAEDPT